MVLSLQLKSQTYLSGTISRQSAGFDLLDKQKNHYLGFGVSFFRDKGYKGKDYTNFIQINPDVYEVVNSYNGSIYLMYGKKYKNNMFDVRLGMGSKIWVYNGKTDQTYWYIVKDGGTYLLYGLDYRRVFNRFIAGAYYDNFNGFGLSAGLSFK